MADQDLSVLRADIAGLKREAAAIAGAPLDHATIRRAVSEYLDDQAASARLDRFEELTAAADHGSVVQFDAERLLVHMFRDELEQRLGDYLVGVTPSPGLPPAKREKALAVLATKRRALEREEELQILAAEDRGEQLTRRSDVDGTLLAELWAEVLADDGRLKAA